MGKIVHNKNIYVIKLNYINNYSFSPVRSYYWDFCQKNSKIKIFFKKMSKISKITSHCIQKLAWYLIILSKTRKFIYFQLDWNMISILTFVEITILLVEHWLKKMRYIVKFNVIHDVFRFKFKNQNNESLINIYLT